MNRIGARQRGVSAALLRVSKIRFIMAVLAVPMASLTTTVASASADTLIGSASVQSGTDSNDDGVAEAFPLRRAARRPRRWCLSTATAPRRDPSSGCTPDGVGVSSLGPVAELIDAGPGEDRRSSE